jgi:hypothetical protein
MYQMKNHGQLSKTLLTGGLVVVLGIFSPFIVQAETEIPVGPGQACIKYWTFYSSLIDWLDGPLEMGEYMYISYEGFEKFSTVHSCAGSNSFPGSLPEGDVFMIHGMNGINHSSIVNIKRIEDSCPYQLTYYRLTNPVRIPDATGICAKNYLDKNQGPLPCPTN